MGDRDFLSADPADRRKTYMWVVTWVVTTVGMLKSKIVVWRELISKKWAHKVPSQETIELEVVLKAFAPLDDGCSCEIHRGEYIYLYVRFGGAGTVGARVVVSAEHVWEEPWQFAKSENTTNI